eukprot:CAMPEP_0181273082 /NCGR_PEP_ID=MMETSP1097-20121128/8414_1 /TAXON_ID=35684 /ORGANISM="Pseudopedinella elastica, Strain CCMP716" /LENGTH=40 /DNA_ID= /DNA_START= /DNA_END= /DNA_ORIENTATION=
MAAASSGLRWPQRLVLARSNWCCRAASASASASAAAAVAA